MTVWKEVTLINILICDPDQNHLLYVENIVNECMRKWSDNYILVKFIYTMDMLDYLMNIKGLADIAVVSINSDTRYENILTDCKYIRKNYPSLNLILTGINPKSIEDLFDITPFNFCYQPLNQNRFSMCLDTLFNEHDADKYTYIKLKNKNGINVIGVSAVKYCESNGRKVTVHEDDGKSSEFYYKLDDIEDILPNYFLRCHKSFLVNMKKIRVFADGGVYLHTDEFIQITVKKYYAVKREYLKYISGYTIDIINENTEEEIKNED